MSGAQTMKIYSIIARIEEELEESPRTKFGGSSNKRVVEIDRLFDLLGDLKVTIPEDIRRATGILAEADNMINDAKEKADEIMASSQEEADQILQQAQTAAENMYRQAQEEYQTKVSDSEVYKAAFARANDITSEAESNANQIYNGARKYADEILSDLQQYLSDYHKMITENRKELNVIPESEQPADPSTEPVHDFNDTVVQADKVEYHEYQSAPNYSAPRMDYRPEQQAMYRNDSSLDYDNPPQMDTYEDESQEYEEKKPKRKGILQRMFEIEDDEYADDDDYEEEEPKKKTRSRRK